MTFQKGDIVLLPVPFTYFRSSKVRPAVVLSGADYHATEPDLILGMITTNLAAATAAVDFVLSDWQAANLHRPSAFKPVIFTVEPSLILYRIGAVSGGDLLEIERRLYRTFGLK